MTTSNEQICPELDETDKEKLINKTGTTGYNTKDEIDIE